MLIGKLRQTLQNQVIASLDLLTPARRTAFQERLQASQIRDEHTMTRAVARNCAIELRKSGLERAERVNLRRLQTNAELLLQL